MDKLQTVATVLIVPGLREHVAEHWQTLLEAKLCKVRSVPPLETDKLDCAARVRAIQHELEQIEGPVILVAHSAGVLMVAHWAAKHSRPIKGALLAAPPDLNAIWPQGYPSSESLRAHGWDPLPKVRCRFQVWWSAAPMITSPAWKPLVIWLRAGAPNCETSVPWVILIRPQDLATGHKPKHSSSSWIASSGADWR